MLIISVPHTHGISELFLILSRSLRLSVWIIADTGYGKSYLCSTFQECEYVGMMSFHQIAAVAVTSSMWLARMTVPFNGFHFTLDSTPLHMHGHIPLPLRKRHLSIIVRWCMVVLLSLIWGGNYNFWCMRRILSSRISLRWNQDFYK
jgi:hypothetical protein